VRLLFDQNSHRDFCAPPSIFTPVRSTDATSEGSHPHGVVFALLAKARLRPGEDYAPKPGDIDWRTGPEAGGGGWRPSTGEVVATW
jgi:hypothetical protein